LRAALLGLALVTSLLVAACSAGSEDGQENRSKRRAEAGAASERGGAVLYTVGVSTDPYGGGSSPAGFGVVLNLGTPGERMLEIRNPDLGWFGGAEWIDERRILVPRKAPPFRPPLIFRLDGERLVREGPSSLPPLHTQQERSPDGTLIASRRIEPCEPNQRPRWHCYQQADEIYLQRADGSGRRVIGSAQSGGVNGWTPNGRLLVLVGPQGPFYYYAALNVRTGKRTLPIRPAQVAAEARLPGRLSLGPPRWSGDGRYMAAMVAGKWRKPAVHGFVIARADGRPIRFVTSPYVISMFAWSPQGHRVAWTTSGFPTPHELFVLDEPTGKPRRLLATDRHFDWITWSPDGRRLLLDDENVGRWRLVPTAGRMKIEALPRLGGRTLWCCPVNAYATFNG
jgi:WD40-like Beta Propeller Repeat